MAILELQPERLSLHSLLGRQSCSVVHSREASIVGDNARSETCECAERAQSHSLLVPLTPPLPMSSVLILFASESVSNARHKQHSVTSNIYTDEFKNNLLRLYRGEKLLLHDHGKQKKVESGPGGRGARCSMIA